MADGLRGGSALAQASTGLTEAGTLGNWASWGNWGTLELAVSGYLVAAIAYAAFSIDARRRAAAGDRRGAPALALVVAGIVSTAWAASGLAGREWGGQPLMALATVLDVGRYAAWLVFLTLLLRAGTSRAAVPSARLVFTGIGAICAFSAVCRVLAEPGDGEGLLARLAPFTAMVLPVCGLVLVEQVVRNASEERRWGIKPVALGLCCIFGFDFYVYSEAALFGRFDGDALSVRGIVHACAVPFLMVASRRNKQWVNRLRVSRTAAFHSAALLLSGAYLLFIAAVGYYLRFFGGTWGRALQLAVLAVALIALAAAALSGSMRAKLRVLLGKHFFRLRYDYRQEWLRFTATLSSGETPHETGTLVIRGLADMLESPAGGLWSTSGSEGEYLHTAQWNLAATGGREPRVSAFTRFLLDTGWIVDLDEFRAHPERYDGLVVPPWLLDNRQFWLVVPLTVTDELIGFVVLAHARTAVEINWEVTDLLKTASRQAASFLAQMRATEALLEVRKFDAFNRMSAFVVHDLKNIVTQLSLMMKNAQRLRDNAEFHDDMLMTIESSLEKMRQLMLQLREGEAPPGGVSGVALWPILRRIEAVAASRGRVLQLRVSERAVTRGHEERVERVIGHVVQNAFDATPADGKVAVHLSREAGRARVEVLDTGHGMSPEFIQSRLFKPFQTTKSSGMGIGAYESYQYIQELGGSISVDSTVGVGTCVTILMPLFDSRQTSDLQMMSES